MTVLRMVLVSVLLVPGCMAGEEDDFPFDTGREDVVRDADSATDPGVRPDGISLDAPLPDGYGLEVAEVGDGCVVRNPCGGCANLRSSPGTPCGGCEGEYACNGPDDVRCVGGCNPVGCADNTREAFLSPTTWPEIAACGGGFQVAGILHAVVSCGRNAGNNSTNPTGTGCSPADLCAEGWRPCAEPREVTDRTAGGMPSDWPASSFFAASVSGPADDEVCGIGTNDIYGVGSAGGSADRGTCLPLTRTSGDQCDDLPSPWDCGTSPGIWQYDEASQVTKPGPGGGGVLCCLGAG